MKNKLMTFTLIMLLVGNFSFGMNYPSNINVYVGETNKLTQNQRQEQNLLDIYKNLDKEILNSGDEKQIKHYLINKNKEIAEYLINKYPKLGSFDELEYDIIGDIDFSTFGVIYAIAEHAGLLDINKESISTNRNAFWECVGGVLGITAIYDLISGASGATYGSTWSVVKKLVKRYVGWIGVGYALYEIATTCF